MIITVRLLDCFPNYAHPQVAALLNRLLPGRRGGRSAGAGGAQPSRPQQVEPQRSQVERSLRSGSAGAGEGQRERQQRQQRVTTEAGVKEGGDVQESDEEQPTPESLDLSRHLRRVYAGAVLRVWRLRVPFGRTPRLHGSARNRLQTSHLFLHVCVHRAVSS